MSKRFIYENRDYGYKNDNMPWEYKTHKYRVYYSFGLLSYYAYYRNKAVMNMDYLLGKLILKKGF